MQSYRYFQIQLNLNPFFPQVWTLDQKSWVENFMWTLFNLTGTRCFLEKSNYMHHMSFYCCLLFVSSVFSSSDPLFVVKMIFPLFLPPSLPVSFFLPIKLDKRDMFNLNGVLSFFRDVYLHEGLALPLVQQLEVWQLLWVPVGRDCILYEEQQQTSGYVQTLKVVQALYKWALWRS